MENDDKIVKVGQDSLNLAAQGIARAEQYLGQSFVEAVNVLFSTRGNIIISGIGKSGIVAQKVVTTLLSTGTVSVFLHPSDAFHGDVGIIKPQDTLLLFSHSGETEELLKLLEIVKELHRGNKVIAITANQTSTLARAADVAVLTHVQVESNDTEFKYIPTTSNTVALALGDALVLALQKQKGFKAQQYFRLHPGGTIGNIAKSMAK